jgi:hypothetical protein
MEQSRQDPSEDARPGGSRPLRPAYQRPSLTRHGDLRSNILGPSPGLGDSPSQQNPG